MSTTHQHQHQQTSHQLIATGQPHVCHQLYFSVDYLRNSQIITNIKCPIPNCDEILSQKSALNVHLKKVHRVYIKNDCDNEYTKTKAKSKAEKLRDNCQCKYFCPIDKCKHNPITGKPLPTFHSLKVHFIRIHGEKKFDCCKCNRPFSIKSEMERHLRSCGTTYKCEICDIVYSTENSYRKHCHKKGHEISIPMKQPNLISLSSSSGSSPSPSSSLLSSCKKTVQIKPLMADQKMAANVDLNQMQFVVVPQTPVYLLAFNPSNMCTSDPTSLPLTTLNNLMLASSTFDQHSILQDLCASMNKKTQENCSQTNTHSTLSFESNPSLVSPACAQQQSQQTQTNFITSISTSTYTDQPMLNDNDFVDDYVDVGTSTSPLLDDIESYLNDISTQTNMPYTTSANMYDNHRSISIQTYDQTVDMLPNVADFNDESPSSSEMVPSRTDSSSSSMHPYANLDTDDYYLHSSADVNIGIDRTTSPYLLPNQIDLVGHSRPLVDHHASKFTMTNFDFANKHTSMNNRCVTPTTMHSYACQTEQFYFENTIPNAISIQTQTINSNVVETQTEFEF